jgi:hypothetical protein
MKVVCVDGNEFDVTFGKIYDVIHIENIGYEKYYKVQTDNGLNMLINKCKFLTIEEFRNKRIEEILK